MKRFREFTEATYNGKKVSLGKPFRTPDGPKKSAVYVDPDGDGKAKIVSFFAKKARGAMARFVMQNRLSRADQIMDFDSGGYEYQPDQSTYEKPVFLRTYRV